MNNMNFCLDEYYDKAKTGMNRGDDSIIEYIKSFPRVILWGGSFQGKAIGKKIRELGVNVYKYWDLRFEEIKEIDGVQVCAPFSTDEKENSLVIVCIGNRVIHGGLIKDLKLNGYMNYIHGDLLYMGLICPFTIETGIKARRCSGTQECRQVYCHRIKGIMMGRCKKPNPLFLPSVTLVINQVCSLKCKYCTSYMNEYEPKERINFTLAQICSDIDNFFGAVDGVGTITVMGGEPFLHPDLSAIIEHLCKWKNFGLISIATSGTCPIKEEQLKGLHDERVNVSFSNYTPTINEKQRELFYKNIDLVKNAEVQCTVGLYTPEWIIPQTLENKHTDDETLKRVKSSCTHWHQIKNGKVHPCDFAQSLYSLHIADYDTDYVDLNMYDGEQLRNKLIEYHNRAFYESCRHHVDDNDKSIMTSCAAEQGYVNMRGNINHVKA